MSFDSETLGAEARAWAEVSDHKKLIALLVAARTCEEKDVLMIGDKREEAARIKKDIANEVDGAINLGFPNIFQYEINNDVLMLAEHLTRIVARKAAFARCDRKGSILWQHITRATHESAADINSKRLVLPIVASIEIVEAVVKKRMEQVGSPAGVRSRK